MQRVKQNKTLNTDMSQLWTFQVQTQLDYWLLAELTYHCTIQLMKEIHRFNAIPIKLPMAGGGSEIEIPLLKFVKESQGTPKR